MNEGQVDQETVAKIGSHFLYFQCAVQLEKLPVVCIAT